MDRPPPNRPIRRAGSGRFPVKISTGAADLAPDPASPASQHRPNPPVSSRSHSRVPSQHSNNAVTSSARRPTATPLTVGLERSRSNSEGILQAARAKRMGIVSRKASDLGTVVESRSNRLSHYRGLSHGSVMHDKPTNGNTASRDGSASPASPAETDRYRGTYVRRLSSLPEHKRESLSSNHIIEGAKGILYALHLVQPHISSLIVVVRDEGTKRSSLERVFYNATTHVDELDRELHSFELGTDEDDEAPRATIEGVRSSCLTCVMAYQVVGTLLSQHVRQIVSHGDPRYVRTLLLLIYGSLVEVRNACVNLCLLYKGRKQAQRIEQRPSFRTRSITPTQERPNPSQRLRSETVVRHSNSRTRRPQAQPPAPLKINGNGPGPVSSHSSNSSATPMSAESFAIPSRIYGESARINGYTGADEADEERQFERIFLTLTRAYEIVLKALPSVQHQFVRCLEVSRKQDTQPELRSLWQALDQKCAFSLQMADVVKVRLSTIKLKEPGVRNQREFWELCNAFVKAFVETALLVKDARKLELIPNDVLQVLRPVQQAVKEVGVVIDASPWKYLAAPQPASATLPPPITQAMIHTGLQQALSGMSVVTSLSPSGPSAGPYVTPLPATPLSAALGPAAQATVPSVPTSQRNGAYANDAYERADSMQSVPSRTLTSNNTDFHGQTPTLLSPMGLRNHARYPG